jgi:single-strand DNA-binding protein
MSINKVILVGNVGKDPEVRYLEGGAAVCKFSLATSEVYKNKDGEKVSTTEWHNIFLWRGLAEIAEKYVKKGMQLYIEGRIKTRSYTDQEGKVKYITEIVGDNMQMLGKKSDDHQSPSLNEPSATKAVENQSGNSMDGNPDDDFVNHSTGTDDLPF